jgi:hypothetical protein
MRTNVGETLCGLPLHFTAGRHGDRPLHSSILECNSLPELIAITCLLNIPTGVYTAIYTDTPVGIQKYQ